MQRRRRPQRHLPRDDAVAVAQRPVAGAAGDVVALAPEIEQFARHRERDRLHIDGQRLAVRLDRPVGLTAGGQRRVQRDALAGDRALGRRLHGQAVRPEVALPITVRLGLAVRHLVEDVLVDAARAGARDQRHGEGESKETRRHRSDSSTISADNAPDARMSASVRSMSTPAGSSTDRKKASTDARAKSSDSKIGWYGWGSRDSAKKPMKAEPPPSRTASSKVIGMFAGGPCGGRLPMLSGQSNTLQK